MNHMYSIRAASVALLAMVAVAAASSPTGATEELRHTRLVKSIPAKDSTISSSPKALQLWFSEKVELPLTSVKLVNAAGANVALDKATRDDAGADAPVVVNVRSPLATGAYTVNWTVAAADGHVVKGSYGFTINTGK